MIALPLVLAVSAIHVPAQLHKGSGRIVYGAQPSVKHRCHTKRCGRLWAEHHPPKFAYRPFELCVANHEAGTGTIATPQNARFNTINWRYSDGNYEGAYNWVNSTWLAMGGGRYAKHAYDATPEQQTLIFRAHANAHDWPRSVPACS